MESGIYCIKNKINGKKYVGQSRNVENRFKEHIRDFNGNRNGSKLIQCAWNKYGKDNFKFYKIISCPLFLLNILETFFIVILGSHQSMWGYNISWGGNSPMKYRKHTQEEKDKLSKNNGRYWLGKTRSDDTKIRISKAKTGKKLKKEHIEKITASHSGKKQANGITSKYIGTYKRNDCDKYRSSINYNGKTYRLGTFKSEIDAAKAYDEKYKELYKTDYAPNFSNQS